MARQAASCVQHLAAERKHFSEGNYWEQPISGAFGGSCFALHLCLLQYKILSDFFPMTISFFYQQQNYGNQEYGYQQPQVCERKMLIFVLYACVRVRKRGRRKESRAFVRGRMLYADVMHCVGTMYRILMGFPGCLHTLNHRYNCRTPQEFLARCSAHMLISRLSLWCLSLIVKHIDYLLSVTLAFLFSEVKMTRFSPFLQDHNHPQPGNADFLLRSCRMIGMGRSILRSTALRCK